MQSAPNDAATLVEGSDGGKARRPRWWAVAGFGLLLAAVTVGSLQPGAPSLQVTYGDKVQHFGAYASLTALAFAACRGRSWPVAAAIVIYGVAIEVAQGAQGLGRFASPLDALANTAGVLAVVLVWRSWRRA